MNFRWTLLVTFNCGINPYLQYFIQTFSKFGKIYVFSSNSSRWFNDLKRNYTYKRFIEAIYLINYQHIKLSFWIIFIMFPGKTVTLDAKFVG